MGAVLVLLSLVWPILQHLLVPVPGANSLVPYSHYTALQRLMHTEVRVLAKQLKHDVCTTLNHGSAQLKHLVQHQLPAAARRMHAWGLIVQRQGKLLLLGRTSPAHMLEAPTPCSTVATSVAEECRMQTVTPSSRGAGAAPPRSHNPDADSSAQTPVHGVQQTMTADLTSNQPAQNSSNDLGLCLPLPRQLLLSAPQAAMCSSHPGHAHDADVPANGTAATAGHCSAGSQHWGYTVQVQHMLFAPDPLELQSDPAAPSAAGHAQSHAHSLSDYEIDTADFQSEQPLADPAQPEQGDEDEEGLPWTFELPELHSVLHALREEVVALAHGLAQLTARLDRQTMLRVGMAVLAVAVLGWLVRCVWQERRRQASIARKARRAARALRAQAALLQQREAEVKELRLGLDDLRQESVRVVEEQEAQHTKAVAILRALRAAQALHHRLQEAAWQQERADKDSTLQTQSALVRRQAGLLGRHQQLLELAVQSKEAMEEAHARTLAAMARSHQEQVAGIQAQHAAERASWQEQLSRLRAALAAVQAELFVAQEAGREKQRRIEGLSSTVDAQQQQICQLEQQNSGLEQEVVSLQQERELMATQLAELTSQLEVGLREIPAAQADLEQARQRCEALEQGNRQKEQQINQLQDQCHALQNEVTELREDREHLTLALDQGRAQLDHVDRQRADLQQKLDAMVDQMNEIESDVLMRDQQVSELASTVIVKESQVHDLQAQRELLERQLQSAEEDNQELARQVHSLQEATGAAQQQVSELTMARQSLETALEAARAEGQALAAQLADAQSACQEAEQKVSKVAEEVKHKGYRILMLQSEVDSLKEKIVRQQGNPATEQLVQVDHPKALTKAKEKTGRV